MRVSLLLLIAAFAAAEDAPTAWDVTERDRGLERTLDLALAPPRGQESAPRTLILLVDPTPALRGAAFAPLLRAAIARHAEKLKSTRIGVTVVGTGKRTLAPDRDHARAVGLVADLLAKPRGGAHNVYEDVRREAARLKREPGRRAILLVTLNNGDLEDDVEATAKSLRRAKVACSVITREAFLSDTYWAWGAPANKPSNLEGCGGDGAFIELPWGWAFQTNYRNDLVGSGFAMWGLSRLAAASGGRVYLWHGPSDKHKCNASGVSCVLCDTDHLPSGLAYWPQRLKTLAPSVARRKDAFAAAARDPFFRATLAAWAQAAELGLTRGEPGVHRAGRTLKPRRKRGATLGVDQGLRFAKQAEESDRLARDAAVVIAALEVDLTKARKAGGAYRYEAMADVTHAMLHITRYNLLAYAAWLREVAPVRMAEHRAKKVRAPPEIARLPEDYRILAVGVSNVSLCHGAKPFLAQRLPGGERLRGELAALDGVLAGALAKHAFTPFAAVLRHAGLARFYLSGRGSATPIVRKPPTKDEDDTTTDDKPEREAPEGTGSGGSPTTGGG